MFDCFLAQLLVLIMLFASELRIFFIKNPRIDCLTVFSPAALVISIINIACFGASVENMLIFLLSLFIFFSNFRSILRFRANLFVDHYSTVFFISSLFNLIILTLLATFIIWFRPARINTKKINAEKQKYHLTGSFSTGIRLREEAFSGEGYSGNLTIYRPRHSEEESGKVEKENPVLLFSSGITATTSAYEPYFLLLAQKGYTIISADFYPPDGKFLANFEDGEITKKIVDTVQVRNFFAEKAYLTDKNLFEKIQEAGNQFIVPRYRELTKLAMQLTGENKKFFYLTDGVDFDTIYTVIDLFPENANGFFSLNRIAEYKTSGFGFIEQTAPLFARTFKLNRDTSLFIPRYVANKTAEYIAQENNLKDKKNDAD